ncbi:NeuD/PglB/VioB family sugar acetyltransferase [Aureivirga sp. CE67]|uniref:NeuD/PglB/VioB family sugar acetyltransferase n=1 Tax=Aureivirga sp. CE67 TaxID=1788983 RepID=UPI0018CB0B2A|nr:NeuD/PglB/VioB family sugar acetyltransferase [Aureivirga sp. CE67]
MERINKKAIIIGAGTYGEVYATYLKEEGFDIIGFVDDNPTTHNKEINGILVLGDSDTLNNEEIKSKITNIFCSIGNNRIRVKMLEKAIELGYSTPNFIHSSVQLTNDIQIGKGVYILPNSIIMPHTVLEDFVMISMGSKIAHHCILKKGSFISTGVNFGANIVLKEMSFVGIGATLMTGITTIGKNVTIGAGAVVIKNVPDNAVIVGNPGKIIKYNK